MNESRPTEPTTQHRDGIPLREVMRAFASGVTVVTTGGRNSHGMTANAFTSVSLDPPLVLCCVGRHTGMRRAVSAAGGFGVSILGADQEDVARHFADRARPSGRAQFERVGWRPGHRTAAPLLTGALAWLECTLVREYEAGDHSILLGEVVSTARGSSHHGLLFFDGAFHRLPASGRHGR